ncbi:ABC transporter permease [Paenibacillus dendritiformis]|uniref:Transport permease protein n=1 Tax=Paenibacillus dendritiformis C454 TaxID=1131935 RepID=H3S9M9_9BACL|nr:ABC transporter permease [Paenibacillus dendritiformis]EHQ64147.1 ABC-2 type transporter [Paenibacillus dendritiformis C454]CAH8767336.1 ABC transporter permease [Paenibacillus dendritiformis]
MKKNIQNFLKYKDLLLELIKKDIKLKYRNSFLGVLWSMLNPLLMMIVLTVIFSTVFNNHIENFPVYVLTGRIVYQFFSEATSFAMDSIHANSQLITKVYVPKYFFPLSRICSSFITTLISTVPLLFVMLVTNISFSWVNIMFIVPLLYLLAISAGIGLLLASITVFFKDMMHLYSIVLMIIMYMTPIFYPASIIPAKYMPIIKLNPLYSVVEMFRDVVIYGQLPGLGLHLICLAYIFVYGIVGVFVFYRTQDRFIYHL